MKNFTKLYLSLFVLCIGLSSAQAQTATSWTGAVSIEWNLATNWTNGIPTVTTPAVLGDASFTGSFQPKISTAVANALSLTLGDARATTLTVNNTLTVKGSVLINAGSTISHIASKYLYLSGNWMNDGTYTAPATGAYVCFNGTAQVIGGATNTIFRKVLINVGSVVTMNTSISAAGPFLLKGTLLPSESIAPVLSGTGPLTVYSSAVLKVTAPTFAGNYTIATTTLNGGSIVDYAATLSNQTIAVLSYSTLTLTGGTVKTPAGNLSLQSATTSYGNVYVNNAIFDLGIYSVSRTTTTVSGTFSLTAGNVLRIGGLTTAYFPANFKTNTLNTTSTVEYYGAGTQVVAAQTYGNLLFTSPSGPSVRAMPATAFIVNGNLVSKVASGTMSYTAGSAVTVNGNDSLDAGTTFDGGASAYIFKLNGNLYNNGTISGNTSSTFTMGGTNKIISGTGTNNFNNLTINAAGVTATNNPINVSGHLAVSLAAGTFTHAAGGVLTMSGSAKTITGAGLTLATLNFADLSSVTCTADVTVAGDLSFNGSGTLSTTAGTLTMTGAGKTITAGTATPSFFKLAVASTGSVTTAANFTITSALNVQGSFDATANTANFNGTASLSGAANLYNVTIAAAKTLQLGANAALGIAGVFTNTGTFNATSTIPNTLTFTGVAQSIPVTTYNNLVLAGTGTKTMSGAVTVAGDLTINPSVTLDAGSGSNTLTLQRNFVNGGSFTAGSGTVTFTGTNDAAITGATTFNILTVAKSSSSNIVTAGANIAAATVNMTTGMIATGTNSLTITITRTGNGIITGIVTRVHAFVTGTAYAFEGPNNLITFTGTSAVTAVTEKISFGPVSDFSFGGAINRTYDISNISGTYTGATLRLHYEDAQLNGNTEATMQFWHYAAGIWGAAGKTSNDATNNFLELTGITALTDRWTLSDNNNVVSWNGTVSTAWSAAGNWTTVQGTPAKPPSINDIVQIGDANFTGANQPTISTAASAKGISFQSAKPSSLSLTTGGSLTVGGNISGTWSANATHTITSNAQNITMSGNLVLSDAIVGHEINLNIGSGTVAASGSLTQSGGANIIFSGAGNLNIGGDFNYSSGTFTAGTGTLTYNGTTAQTVAPVTYNNLAVNKSAGIASINNTTIGGNLTATSGELDVNAKATITGNILIGASGKIVKTTADSLIVGGNWTNSGVFTPATGVIVFSGSGAQTLSGATTFNRLAVSKTAGSTVTLAANVTVNSDLSIASGNLNLATFTANRASVGGTFALANGSTLFAGGAANFPANYSSYNLDTTSTGTSSNVQYTGTVAQTIAAVSYGNISFSGSGTKTFTAATTTTVKGDLTIAAGTTVNGSTGTLLIGGNWTNSGTFVPASNTCIFNGISKTITGNTTLFATIFNGSYTVAGTDLTFNSALTVASGAVFNAGSGLMTSKGDFTNSGSAISSGTITFTGTTAQNIRVQNAVMSTSTGIVNFNGTVSPIFNSTTNTNFATVNINNTAGVVPDIPWNVFVALNVASGASWNGGGFTHNFFGSFTNNGTVSSSGILNFTPSAAQTLKFTGTAFTSTGNVVLGGLGAIATTGAATTFNNLNISNTAGVTPGTNWTINGDLNIASMAVLNAGANSYSIAGDLSSTGTLNPGISLFTMTGADGILSGNATTTFYDLAIATGGYTNVAADFNIARNLSTAGNIDAASAGSVIFTGGLASVISGTATNLSGFEVAKDAGVAVTLARNIDSLQSVEINGGLLDAGSFTITQDPSTGAVNRFMIGAAGVFKTAGIFPVVTNYGLDSLSTTEYYSAAAQTVQSLSGFTRDGSVASAYGKLTISGAGTKTANGPLNVRSDLTLSAGTLAFANFPDTLAGNWNMIAGTFTPGTGSLVFNGGAVQSIFSTGAFSNININKSGGYLNLSADATATGNVVFTAGKIHTNSFKFIAPGGTISGASAATGWVNGNLQKSIGTGAVTKSFEIGGTTSYTPLLVSFANVSAGGDLIAKATNGEHPQLATSGLDSLKDVNRYWTLTNSGVVFPTADVTLNWLATNVDAGAITANFIPKLYTAGTWSSLTYTSPLATSIKATGLTTFGDFAVGEHFVRVWTGAVSTAWNTAGNWNPATVPGTTEDLLIPVGSFVDINTAVTCHDLTINNPDLVLSISPGNSLTVNGALSLTNGIVSINGETLTLNGTFNGSAVNAIRGSKTSALMIGSSFSDAGTPLYFDQTGSAFYNYLKTFTANKTVTLASMLNMAPAAGANTGTVSISSGATLNTGGFLVLKSDTTGTARIAPLPVDGSGAATAFINGTVSIERNIPARRVWRLLSSPLKNISAPTINAAWQEGVTTASGTPNPNPGFGTHITGGTVANGFDQSPTNGSSIKYWNTSNFSLQPLPSANVPITNYPGYYVFVRGDRSVNLALNGAAPATITTLRMQGSVNTGRQAVSISGTNYTLVGNPFPSAIDFGSLTKSNVANTIYLWDPKLGGNNGFGGYVTGTWNAGSSSYVFTGAASPVSQYVASGEAFFVASADNVNPGTLTIKETDKSTDGSDRVFGFAAQMNGASLRVDLMGVNADNSTSIDDGTLVIFGNDNSNAITPEDARKFTNGGENISVKRNGTLLSIEQRQPVNDHDTIPLNVTQLKAQRYRLQIAFVGLPPQQGLTAYLKDNYAAENNDRIIPTDGSTIEVDFLVTAAAPASYAANRFSIAMAAAEVLPVNFTAVAAKAIGKNIEVSWKTENEIDMNSYQVQSSLDGIHFTNAASVAVHVNHPGEAYAWLDLNVTAGKHYYRIKGIENNGHNIYSQIASATSGENAAELTVKENSGDRVRFMLSNAPADRYTAVIYDMSGRLLANSIVVHGGSSTDFEIPLKAYSTGRYQLRLIGPQKIYTVAFIKY